ncbi:MAG TPA: glycosyltransferase, partial [Candidatus Acidoferrales bacterium]|nr:glycosyltransferase [Candidatus Acidoferrales bacterium]
GFVCTNYKNSSYTREAVRSLLKNDGNQFRVVVVDNNSDEENVEALKSLATEFQEVELILSKENEGYFRGLNLGIRHLRSSQPDINIMVVGNNDVVFPADFADSIRRNLSTFEKYAVVSPDITTLDGVHQNPHVIGKIGKFREFIYDLYYANYYLGIAIRGIAKLSRSFTDRPDENHHDVAQEIYQGYGACYVLGPVFFRHFEELWAPTFLMHEEYFLSKQLSDDGLSVYYEPSIKVLHRCHGAIGAITGRKAWETARSAQKIYRQHVRIFD